MTGDVIARLRSRLLEERAQVLAQTPDLETTARIGTWNLRDPGDSSTALLERVAATSLATNGRRLVDRIDLALARMDDGTYGTCEVCGSAIPAARLEALPYATLCVEDQSQQERLALAAD